MEELVGAEITEERIINAAVRSTAQIRADEPAKPSRSSAVKRFLKGDYAPALILAVVIARSRGVHPVQETPAI